MFSFCINCMMDIFLKQCLHHCETLKVSCFDDRYLIKVINPERQHECRRLRRVSGDIKREQFGRKHLSHLSTCLCNMILERKQVEEIYTHLYRKIILTAVGLQFVVLCIKRFLPVWKP